MKRILCIVLSVLLVAALFAGCGSKAGDADTTSSTLETITVPVETIAVAQTSKPVVDGIHYKGLGTKDVTVDTLAAAEGRKMDAQSTVNDMPLYIYNNVSYLDLTFFQLQCIVYGDKTTLTLTYTLSEGETVEAAMDKVSGTVDGAFGEHTVSETSGGSQILTWRQSQYNENYICLYPNGEAELKLCFYLF